MFVLCACMRLYYYGACVLFYACIVCLYAVVFVCGPGRAYVCIVFLCELVLVCKPVCLYVCVCVFCMS